jgi:hypothetical protein
MSRMKGTPPFVGSEEKKKSRITVTVDELNREMIEDALELARHILATDSNSQALGFIAFDWLFLMYHTNPSETKLPPIERILRVLEKAYGVKLAVMSNEAELTAPDKVSARQVH